MAVRATIREAALRLGVSQDTIRRRMRRGELQGVKVETPQGYTWYLDLPDDEPHQEPQAEGQRASTISELDHLREVNRMLQDEVETRRREVSELHILLQQAQRLLPMAPESPQDAPGRAQGGRRSWWRVWDR